MINTFVILLTLLFVAMKFFGVVTWGMACVLLTVHYPSCD